MRSERSVWGVCCQELYAYRDGYRYRVYADSLRRRGPALEGYLLVEVTRVGVPGRVGLVSDSHGSLPSSKDSTTNVYSRCLTKQTTRERGTKAVEAKRLTLAFNCYCSVPLT